MTGQSPAQTQTSTSVTTGVFALLRAKPGVTQEQVMAVMPAEIRATVQLISMGKSANGTHEKTAGRCFPPERLGRRRGEIHHEVFATC